MSDRVSSDELMGRNEYAEHQNVSPAAVAKAIKSGRITKAVIWEGGKVKAIKWRLADELWRANTDIDQALRGGRKGYPTGWGGDRQLAPPPAPAAVETSGRLPARNSAPTRADLEHLVGKILSAAFADSLPTWPAMLVARYQLTPAIAVECVLDGLLVLVDGVCAGLGLDDIEFPIPAALEWRDGPASRDELRAAVEKLALKIRADFALDAAAAAGEASGETKNDAAAG